MLCFRFQVSSSRRFRKKFVLALEEEWQIKDETLCVFVFNDPYKCEKGCVKIAVFFKLLCVF